MNAANAKTNPKPDAPLLSLTEGDADKNDRAALSPLARARRVSPLLLILTLVPVFLLSLAVWESVETERMARDINQSGSLRYRSLWVYGATHRPDGQAEDWQPTWQKMQTIRTTLRARHPIEVPRTDAAWNAFSEELQKNGRVSWDTTNTLRDAADALTNTLEAKVRMGTRLFRTMYAGGILALALSLPWSWRISRRLRRTLGELKGKDNALADAAARYERLFEGLPSACFGYDRTGRIITWNHASEVLFGKKAGEVIGLPLWEAISRRENWERNQRIVHDVLAGNAQPDLEWNYSAPDGTQKDVLSTVFPLYGVSGDVQGGISANVDITERKRAAESLQALTSELQRSNRELAAFASVASHDLKEPLRKIETFGSLLRRKAGDNLTPDCVDYLDRMTGAASRMQHLINGLLEYGRVSTVPRTLRAVDLTPIVREVISDLEARIADTGGTVEVGPLPTVWADELQMRQLFQNLIANALKFHKPDTAPHVRVWWEPDNSKTARVLVSDNGIGFDEKYAERIFEVFERLDGKHGNYEGTGVGLAICRKIADQHGGTITAQSTPGLGATFTITLPERGGN